MENRKSNNLAVCIICGILTVFGIVASIVSLCIGRNELMLLNIINLALAVLIGYYAIRGYRKPNGNILKYVILIYAASYLCKVYLGAQNGAVWQAVINASVIGLSCYMAGRLHRVRQNMIFMMLVIVLIVLKIVDKYTQGGNTIGIFTPLILWLDICVAYILRYKEHKEAGLIDAPKN